MKGAECACARIGV